MISIPGSLSFANLVMMSSAPAKSAGDARYASQDPFIRLLSHTISTPNAIRSAFFLRRTRQMLTKIHILNGFILQGRVVRKPINANPRLNVNRGFQLAH